MKGLTDASDCSGAHAPLIALRILSTMLVIFHGTIIGLEDVRADENPTRKGDVARHFIQQNFSPTAIHGNFLERTDNGIDWLSKLRVADIYCKG